MVEIPAIEGKGESSIETWVGLCVVILATFLGVVNVKDENIVQAMQRKQADRIDNWNWYQARKIKAAVYDSFAEELAIPYPGETPEISKVREAKAARFRELAKQQTTDADKQKSDAEHDAAEYNALNAKDDQFDLCEAAMAISLALMGVTALVKRWWLFFVALVPSTFGVAMGIAGFLGADTNSPIINWVIRILS